jgi:hypothetical protein
MTVRIEEIAGNLYFRNSDGSEILRIESGGRIVVAPTATLVVDGNAEINSEFAADYAGTHSFQIIPADLTLEPQAGKTGDTAFLAPVMGNVMGDVLSKLGNYIGGLIGMFSVTGARASTFPIGGVLGIIADGVTDADGAVVAVLDGDSATTTAGAAFKVKNNNSTAASGFDFGLDLQDAAHDGFQPVDSAFYLKAPARFVDDVCELIGGGAPTDGVTGANIAGPGSRFTRTDTGKLYINTGSKAVPTWTVVGTQS